MVYVTVFSLSLFHFLGFGSGVSLKKKLVALSKSVHIWLNSSWIACFFKVWGLGVFVWFI